MLGIVYHTGYLTDDLARAVDFYRTTFGGELLMQVPTPDGGRIAYVKAGDSEVELIEPGDKSRLGGRTGLVVDHVGYFVADLEKAMAELKAKGIKFTTPEPTVSAAGYRMIYLDAGTTMGTKVHLTEVRK